MFSKFIVIFFSCCLLHSCTPEKVQPQSFRVLENENVIKIDENISEFNGWASLASRDFSYNKLKEGIPAHADYIILASAATNPVSFEAILAYQSDGLNFSFWSSDYNEVIKCKSFVSELSTDIVDNNNFPEKGEFGYDIHPFYTIVEKREGDIITVGTYDFFSDYLWVEFNKLRDHLLNKTPESCSPFNAKDK